MMLLSIRRFATEKSVVKWMKEPFLVTATSGSLDSRPVLVLSVMTIHSHRQSTNHLQTPMTGKKVLSVHLSTRRKESLTQMVLTSVAMV